MAYLYISPKGTPWRKHSYSAGNDYDQCPYKYYLRRVLGWREKENKARFLFGRALEESIQYHHDHNGVGAVSDFTQRWSVYKDRKDIIYTAVERDWETLNLDGQEMVRLYQIRQPSLPIPMGGRVIFQKPMSREVFPGDPNYGGIFDEGKLDIIAYADPNHILLPRVEWRPDYGVYRPVIIDIKTSGIDFPEQPGIAAYDKQLRRYSWLSGIRDVALLGFKKAGRSLKKSSSITLLEDPITEDSILKAGDEGVIAAVNEDVVWVVKNDYMVEEMDRQGDGKTKAGKEARTRWIMQYGALCRASALTRQRLQFISGLVSLESANDAGAIAGRQIVQIVNSWNAKSWPQTFGIRFPNDDRNDPYFRAFVLEDENYRNEHFSKSAEESFDDLLEETEEE